MHLNLKLLKTEGNILSWLPVQEKDKSIEQLVEAATVSSCSFSFCLSQLPANFPSNKAQSSLRGYWFMPLISPNWLMKRIPQAVFPSSAVSSPLILDRRGVGGLWGLKKLLGDSELQLPLLLPQLVESQLQNFKSETFHLISWLKAQTWYCLELAPY